jgi:murein L,D-transpeptidase YcbB/YkuD
MTTVIRNQKTGLLVACLILLSLFLFARPSGNAPQPIFQGALLQKEVSRYQEIEQKGGWQKIVLNRKQYKQNESAPFIRQLKKRLQATGDLSGKDTSSLFTLQLEAAVKKVQRQFGLKESGIADALLVAALNVPVQSRIRQLEINLQRSQSFQATQQGRQIVVNIPEFKLHVYENGSHVFDMNVVVGTEKTQTAIFSDELTHIVFSPYWNVPPSIVENEILPAMRKNRRYLANNGYEQTGTENGLPVIRQKPGKNNSLGLVKFLFPNEHAIYFHDTPAKSLFNNRIRAYSHGCVRLAEPAKLASYLLENDPSWNSSKIAEAMGAGKEQWVKLNQAVPVSILYLTAWVDDEGVLNFRDDIYEMDKALPVAMKTSSCNGSI